MSSIVVYTHVFILFFHFHRHRQEAMQSIHELRLGERFGDHMIGPTGDEVLNVIGQCVPSYS